MLSRLIQQKVPIGSRVKFTLKTGAEILGILIEIGRDHISLENKDGMSTILTESIGAWEVIQKETETPEEKGLEKKPPKDNFQIEAIKKIIEIETRFQARLQSAKLELKPPDFVFHSDEIKGQQKSDAITILERIKNKYEYAKKVNELGAKFGRIQPIAAELKSLVDKFPTSSSLKSHLAYLYFLLGNSMEAIKLYEEAAIYSQNVQNWFNWAVLALRTGKEKLACYALEQVFYRTAITEEIETWHIYIGSEVPSKTASAAPMLYLYI